MQVNKSKTVVIARLTAVREVGVRTIIEVHSDASFNSFYQYYTQEGMKRSTKELIRTTGRNEGIRPWYRAYCTQPGLEVLATRMLDMKQFKSVKIRILKKRAYRQLLEAAPDVLGLTKVEPMTDPRFPAMPTPRIPVRIPVGWLTIQDRMDILTGRSR